MNRWSSILSRVLFVGAFVLAGLAVSEKLVNLFDYTLVITGPYTPTRLVEFSAVALLFVIALQLRAIKRGQGTAGGQAGST